VAAQRLYEQGLRAFYRGSLDAAASLFDAALAEDSTLTMAAYYGSLVGVERGDRDRVYRLGAHALRMADRAPARDRLLVRVAWMNVTNDPRELVLAESLAVRYPNDPEAVFAWGRALTWSLDGSAAITQLRRVVTLEGPSVRDDRPLCRACDALWMIFGIYVNLDSLAAAERTAREWIRTQPTAGRPWASLSAVLEMAGRDSEAVAAAAEAVRRGTALNLTILRARLAMRRGHLAAADRFLADVASEPANRLDALWWRVISLRNQRRLDDALTVAGQYRRLADSASGRRMTLEATVPVAQTLFEMGRYRTAAALFDSIAAAETSAEGVAVGVFARRKVWLLTQSSVARAAAGDTADVARLAAEVEALGRTSGFGRDRRLHHYVRALAARARGEPAEAVRELRAMGPAIAGYSRAGLDLGRALTALGRSAEAVPVLRRPLHSALDASGYYVTFREIHEALADAFAASGQADSATAHRAWVKQALGT
jgi:tetratricopeptide (TPR) repeat protein